MDNGRMEQDIINEEEEFPEQFYSPNTLRAGNGQPISQETTSQSQNTNNPPQGSQNSSQENPTSQAGKAGAKSKVQNPCLMCGKTTTSGAVQCTICSMWCHMTCTKLSKEALKGLEVQAKKVGQAYWACRSCMNFNHKWNTLIKETSRRQDATDSRVEDNR